MIGADSESAQLTGESRCVDVAACSVVLDRSRASAGFESAYVGGPAAVTV